MVAYIPTYLGSPKSKRWKDGNKQASKYLKDGNEQPGGE